MLGIPQTNWVSPDTKEEQIVSLLQRPLLDLQLTKSNLQLTSFLLDKWEFTSPTSFRLTLNKEIFWDDKKPLVASHLIDSWKELLQAYPENYNASLLFCISNAKNFAERRALFSNVGIQSTDPYVIDLKFHSPCPNFPYLLSHMSLSPRMNYMWSVNQGSLLPRPLDTLSDWKIVTYWPENEMHLELSPKHWDKDSLYKIDNLKISFFKTQKDALQLFEDNQLDVVLTGDNQSANIISPSESFPTLESVVLVFNSYRKPFQNSKAREVMSLAIQKGELPKLLGSKVDETYRLLPFLNGDLAKGEFAPAIAKRIQSEIKLGAMSLSVPKDPLLQDVAGNLVAQWKKNLGVDVEITSASTDNPMMSLKRFRPNFYKKALGLEGWVEFSSSDFLSPALSPLSTESSSDPFKLYEDRLIKMEKWAVEEENLVLPLITIRKSVYLRKGISGLKYQAIRDVFDFNSVEKN